MSVENTLAPKKIGFAIVSGAGDTYPSVRIAQLLEETHPEIEIEWVVVGWRLPLLQKCKNLTLIEVDDWELVMEAGKPNPSPEAMALLGSKFQEFEQAVLDASQHWDAAIMAPALIICEVAEHCKTIPLSFQNSFFEHPDSWIHNTPTYELYAAKQKFLDNADTASLLLWPEAIYSISPPPKEPHTYVGYPKTTSSGALPDTLQAFLKECDTQKTACAYMTMGSLSVKTKEEWQVVLKALTQHLAVVVDCRHQPISKEEALACQTQYPLYLVEQDLNLEALFPAMDWIVCHGGVGTVAMAIYCEKPLLLMPGHFEQKWWCRKHVDNGYAQYLKPENLEQEGYLEGVLSAESQQHCLEKVTEFKQASRFDGLEKAAETIFKYLTQ